MPEAFYSAAIKAVAGGAWNLYKRVFKGKPLSLEEIKKRAQILFVDDETHESLLSTIREAGWNVRHVKDITNFDSPEVKEADVIFMDYKGVGTTMTPTEEGIGLAKVLKEKYPLKRVIFYSGYAGFIPGHEIHGVADGWVSKNSDPFVYIAHIEESAKAVYAK